MITLTVAIFPSSNICSEPCAEVRALGSQQYRHLVVQFLRKVCANAHNSLHLDSLP